MFTRAQTIVFILVGLFIVIAWDVLAASLGGDGATISEITRDAAAARLVVAGALGFLLGHLVWFARDDVPLWRLWTAVVAVWIAAAAIAFAALVITAAVALAAFPCGRLLWGQRAPAKAPSP